MCKFRAVFLKFSLGFLLLILIMSGFASAQNQTVTGALSQSGISAGDSVMLTVSYQATDDDLTTGLGLRVHFDSSKLSAGDVTGLLSTGLAGAAQFQDDSSDFDNDSSTDKFLNTSWFDFGGSWPNGTTLPAALYSLPFTAQSGFTATIINFSKSSNAAGYTFVAESVAVAESLSVAITSAPLINSDNNNDSYSVSGTCNRAEAAVFVEMTSGATSISGGSPTSCVDGVWAQNNLDAGGLNEGVITVTASAQSGSEQATASLEVSKDVTGPVITAPASITVAATDASGTSTSTDAITAYLDNATGLDNVDSSVVITSSADSVFPLGSTTVVFSATDAFGNLGAASSVVTVTDQTAPVVTAPAPLTAFAVDDSGTAATTSSIASFLGSASAADNVDGDVSVSNNAPAQFVLGVTTVTFIASDAAGNTDTAVAVVTVVPDDDGDGVANTDDAFPLDSAETLDTDLDGIGNNADTDDDGDGLDDTQEQSIGTDPFKRDSDYDSLSDKFEFDSKSRDPLVADYSLAAGSNHTCVTSDLGVSCWAEESRGRIMPPNNMGPVSQLSLGNFHSCAVTKKDGKIYCWDDDGDQQLTLGLGFSQISAGGYHSCALKDEQIVCFGNNSDGQLDPPVLNNVLKVASGPSHACALANNTISCWGKNHLGQSDTPNLSNPIGLFSGGEGHVSCASHDDGWSCWGDESKVSLPPESLSKSADLAIGRNHMCAVDNNKVECWGDNFRNMSTPPDLSNPVQIQLGTFHSCALSDSGVDCWGDSSRISVPSTLRFGDYDGDGTLDDTDIDDDNDGVADANDVFPLDATESIDTDSDGTGNSADTDDDGDGVLDADDAYPLISLNGVTDTDFDGLPNECDSDCLDTGMTADTDDDGDTISDADEATSGTNPLLADTDRDGFSDAQELIDATDPLDKDDCATCTPPVSGIAYHWNNHALLESVDVSLVGLIDGIENDFAEQSLSSASGQYAFTQKHRGTNHLTASKVITDGESGSVISSADALAAIKIAVGINPNTDPDGSGPLEALPVSPYQYIAADINGDGRITSADALAIIKMAVKFDSAEPRSWVFVSEDYEFWDEASKSFLTTRADITWNSSGMSFEYPEKSIQNVVGVLMGDVNGNWSPPEGSEALGESYLSELIKSQGGSLGQWGLVDKSVEDDASEAVTKASDIDKVADGKEYSQDLSSVEIVVNGTVRDYYVYVPSSSDTSPIPLLYLLNGGSAERTPFEQQSNFEAMADREGIVLVVPVSQKLPSNESAWQLNADNSSMQDIDYIEAIYTDVSSRTAVDANRVYAIGYSLGGMFSYELVCQMSNRFAAIGSLAGSMPVAPTYCDPYRNVPILHVHGVQDEIIPYSSQWEWKAWDAVGTMRDTPSLIGFWSSRYNCSKQSKTSITATVDLDVREDCDSGARVEHYRLENGTHVWPTLIGDLETPEVFWSFLSSFSLESTSP